MKDELITHDDVVRECIATIAVTDLSSVEDTISFDDLDFDSVNIVELIVALGEKYNVEFGGNELNGRSTIASAVALLDATVPASSQ